MRQESASSDFPLVAESITLASARSDRSSAALNRERSVSGSVKKTAFPLRLLTGIRNRQPAPYGRGSASGRLRKSPILSRDHRERAGALNGPGYDVFTDRQSQSQSQRAACVLCRPEVLS